MKDVVAGDEKLTRMTISNQNTDQDGGDIIVGLQGVEDVSCQGVNQGSPHLQTYILECFSFVFNFCVL